MQEGTKGRLHCYESEGSLVALAVFFFFFFLGPERMLQMHRSHVGLLCYPRIIQVFLTSQLSLLVRPPRPCNPRDPLVAKGGTAWARIMAGNFA